MTWDERVSVDGWSATTGPVPEVDAQGCAWVLTKFDGWVGGVPPRQSIQPNLFRDGAVTGAPLFEGRTVILGGTVVAPSRAQLLAAMDRVDAVLAGSPRKDLLIVDESVRSVARQAVVELASATMVERISPTAATFSLALFAPDKNRYSVDLGSLTTVRFTEGGGRAYDLTFNRTYGAGGVSGLLNVVNAGNKATFPVVTFTGPLVNPVIQFVGGDYVGMGMTVNPGEQLVIDMQAETARLNDATRNNFLMLGSRWFSLPKGASQLYFSADSGSGSATVQWRDAT